MNFFFSAILVILLTWVLGPFAKADMVENIEGATAQQKEVVWIWKYLGDFVRACVQSGKECQASDIKPVLEKVLRELPTTPQPSTSEQAAKIQFVSERTNPGLFQTNAGETHRAAVTEMKPNAVIYINTDRLAEAGEKWVGILVHEMVHHLGIPDDSARLPDRAGAAVASFVASTWQNTSLEEFGHPEMRLMIFSDPAGDRPLRGYALIRDLAMDVEGAPNQRVPICNADESFRGQKASAMLWRVLKVDGGESLVHLKGSSRVENFCQKGSQLRKVLTNFSFLVNLRFKTPVDPKSDWWNQPSTIEADAAIGNNDGADERIDLNRTFTFESLQNDQAKYGPGQTWRVRAVVESMDGFAPQACTGVLTASRWPFIRSGNMNYFETFQGCEIKSLGNNRWQVDLTHTFPQNARSDSFNLAFIYLANSTDARYAVTSRPSYVSLVNPNDAPALTAVSWGSLGLERTSSLMGMPIVRSFIAPIGKEFLIEFQFTGQAKILEYFLDVDMIIVSKGNMVIMPRHVNINVMKDLVKSVETGILRNGGTYVGLKMTMPSSYEDVQVVGFKLRRLSMKTDDYSWVEVPGMVPSEGWFITPELANAKN